jgi:outer membrane receptor for ferrienterochelin and colicins
MLIFKSIRAPWALAAISFISAFGAARADETESSVPVVDEVVVIAQRLNEARNSIQTQTGASTYLINQAAIDAAPGGDNSLLNQVVMQAPDVAQDSFGQYHVRGEHNGLQYRLNGIILPEGISVFGQSLDPRLISSMSVITGALPAEYGLRTAGIIDLTTKSGLLQPGGAISLYGGSHGTVEPSINYGGSSGSLSYFVSGDFLRNDLGIESPDGSSNPIHDHTTQYHGFGYFEDILNEQNRVALMLGSSVGKFQIPNLNGVQPSAGLAVNGQTAFPSQDLDENQREVTQFGALSWQHSAGALDVQSSFIARYSSLTFTPDPLGDLLFTGIAQHAFKQNVGYALQSCLSAHRHSHDQKWPICAERSFDQRYHLPSPADGRCGHATERYPNVHCRQRIQDRVDRELLPARRMEAVVSADRQLRRSAGSIHRVHERQPSEPSCECGMAGAT